MGLFDNRNTDPTKLAEKNYPEEAKTKVFQYRNCSPDEVIAVVANLTNFQSVVAKGQLSTPPLVPTVFLEFLSAEELIIKAAGRNYDYWTYCVRAEQVGKDVVLTKSMRLGPDARVDGTALGRLYWMGNIMELNGDLDLLRI